LLGTFFAFDNRNKNRAVQYDHLGKPVTSS
jgi:hypothetical protein